MTSVEELLDRATSVIEIKYYNGHGCWCSRAMKLMRWFGTNVTLSAQSSESKYIDLID